MGTFNFGSGIANTHIGTTTVGNVFTSFININLPMMMQVTEIAGTIIAVINQGVPVGTSLEVRVSADGTEGNMISIGYMTVNTFPMGSVDFQPTIDANGALLQFRIQSVVSNPITLTDCQGVVTYRPAEVYPTTMNLGIYGCPANYYERQIRVYMNVTYFNGEYDANIPYFVTQMIVTRPDGTTTSVSFGQGRDWVPGEDVLNQPGEYTFRAHYAGNSTYAPCDGVAVCTVNPPNPDTLMPFLEVTPPTANAGQSILVSGRVTDGDGGDAWHWENGGRVHFYLIRAGITTDIGGLNIPCDGCGDHWYGGGYYEKLFVAPATPGAYILRVVFSGDLWLNDAMIETSFTVIPGPIVKRNVYMMGWPNDPSGLVLPGQTVQLGVGIYVGDHQDCPPGCGSLPPMLDVIPGTVQVKIYFVMPGSGGGATFYKTVNITNGTPYFESYVCNQVGAWRVVYVFDGNAEYNSHQMTIRWDVAECNADIYEQCPDGSEIKTFSCVNGMRIATGNSCPTLPTTMACDSGNYNGLGALGKVGDRFYFHANVTGTVYGTPNQPIGGIPINVFVRKPSDSNLTTLTTLATGNDGGIRADYYPMQAGRYYFRFEFNGGMVNGIARGPSSCDVVFDIVPCYSGEVLETRTCPDGSVIDILTCVDNQPYETGNFCPGTECRTTHASMECQNGNEWDCIDNFWVDIEQPCGECLTAHPTGHACIDGKLWVCLHGQMVGGILPPPVWTNTGIDCCDQDQVILCDDGSTVILKRCIDNVLYPTGLSCHGPTPDNTMLIVLVSGIAIAGAGVAIWMLRKPRAK